MIYRYDRSPADQSYCGLVYLSTYTDRVLEIKIHDANPIKLPASIKEEHLDNLLAISISFITGLAVTLNRTWIYNHVLTSYNKRMDITTPFFESHSS